MTIDQRWKKKRTMGPLVSETFLGSAERKKENKEEKTGKEERGKEKKQLPMELSSFFIWHCLCASVNCFNCVEINIIFII